MDRTADAVPESPAGTAAAIRDREDTYQVAVLSWVAAAGVSDLALVCAGAQTVPASVPTVSCTGCVADLPSYRYADLALAGVRTIRIAAGPCHHGADLAAAATRAADPVSGLVAVTTEIVAGGARVVSPGQVPLPRRGLLRRPPESRPRADHPATAGPTARLGETLRLLSVVPTGHPPEAVRLQAVSCIACGVCVQACPSGSLSLRPAETAGALSLFHVPGTCDAEQRCVSLCPESALSVIGWADWADVADPEPVELASVNLATCGRCHARYPATPGSQFCPACRERIRNPFGSALPPGAPELLRRHGL